MNINIEEYLLVRDRLAKISDELNKKIIEFETELENIKFGVKARIKLDNGDNFLIYKKADKGWHIYFATKDEEWKLIDAPRSLRYYGYKHRMKLLPALKETAESLANKIEKALADEED